MYNITNFWWLKMDSCLICGGFAEKNHFLCSECAKFALFNTRCCPKCGNFVFEPDPSGCNSCRKKGIYFDKIQSIFIYSGAVAMLISTMKYNKIKYLAEILGNFIAKNTERGLVEGRTVIFPPMYFTDKLLRGFNQSEIMADRVASFHKLDFDWRLLKKCRKTEHQANLDFEKRITNLKDSFKLTRAVKNESFLIVDDVCTTASTVNEIASLLKKNGAKSVNAVTLARRTLYFS